MICQQCQTENPSDAKFCGSCGAPMAPPPPPPSPEPAAATGQPAVTEGMNLGIIIGTVFVPLLGVIMGAIYMGDSNPEKKAVGRRWLYIGIGVFVGYCILGMMCGILSEMSY